jgi:hypothetical protein
MLSIFISGCSGEQQNKDLTENENLVQTENKPTKTQEPQDELKDSKITTDAKESYSLDFLKKLDETYPGTNIQLKNKSLFLNGKKYALPQLFPLNKSFTFQGQDENTEAKVVITQRNFTSLDFEFTYTESGKTKLKNKGIAHLSPYFFKDSELDEDFSTSEMYDASEYIDESFSKTHLRISNQLDENKEMRIRVLAFDNKGNEVELLPLTLRGKLK